ncbi:beta-N-acetylhexosaminidase [Nocardia brasiliensis]|uniref:beta-N-acetylhexosaminidase n=1 Tax=Nocardia brasiliensis TaxID=37326 RepID=UPI0024578A2C|nr:glycoside hydrolase family 20 protein [Nocardia brasiliensis]
MNRRTLLALPVLALALAPTPAAAAAAAPVSVPGVRRFDTGPGQFILAPAGARVTGTGPVGAVAARLAADLGRAGHAVGAGTDPGRPGDVVLRVDPSGPAEPESYRIEIADLVTVTARTAQGVGYGTQTLLQWLSRSATLPRGTATDWPDFAERGLLLDVGRQFLSVDWIKQRIREMAFYRMNLLQLHLSDHYGFRPASSSHPEITSAQHYSTADLAEIISYAADFGIEVVPEIGFPGHMNAILAPHPDLILHPAITSPIDAATDGLLAGTADGRIDLSNPRARPLIEDLLHEFVPLFPGRYFHLGGDEYVSDFARYPQLTAAARTQLGPWAAGADLVADTVNWANDIVRSYGRTARVWNDGIPRGASIPVHPSIVVDHWTGGNGLLPWSGNDNGPEQLADQGHTLGNSAFTPTYWASGGYAAPMNAPPALLYAWDPGLFVNGSRLRPDQRAHLLGSKLHVWCDDPTAMTEEQMIAPVRERLPIMAQQLWSGTGNVGYLDFTERVRVLGVPTI